MIPKELIEKRKGIVRGVIFSELRNSALTLPFIFVVCLFSGWDDWSILGALLACAYF